MKNSFNFHSTLGHLIPRCLLLGVTSALTCHAAVTINSSFHLDAVTNLYTYSYSVTNAGLADLALVSIPTDSAASISAIMAPTGFTLTFDSFGGFINLLEDSDLFTDQTFASGSTISPFQFTSALAPSAVTFTAFDVDGNEFTGSTIAPIPEPSSLFIFGVALVSTTVRRRRR